jgi:peroxiredoxin
LLKHWRGGSLLLSTHSGAVGATGADRRNELLFSWALEADTFKKLGYGVALLSTEPIENTRMMSQLMGDPPTTISDPELAFAKALGLPTVNQMGSERYAELTLVVHQGEIGHVFKAERAADARSEVATVLRSLREVHD